eukprot:jgi/Galph1/2554/GphlegSOOS_G1224.1
MGATTTAYMGQFRLPTMTAFHTPQYIPTQSVGRRHQRDWESTDGGAQGDTRFAGHKRRRFSSRERDHSMSSDEEEPMSFKEFLSREDNSITPEVAQEAYKAYKKEFYKRKPKYFFERHKDEEWFCEKYNPVWVLERVKRIRQSCREKAESFRQMLEKDDIDATIPVLEATSPVQAAETSHSEGIEEQSNQPEVSPTSQLETCEAEQSKKVESEEQVEEHQDLTATEERKTVCFLRGIPSWMSRSQIESCLKYVKKEDEWEQVSFIRLKLSEVKPEKNLERFGWAYYSTMEDAKKVMNHWNGQKITKPGNENQEMTPNNDSTEEYYVFDIHLNHESRKRHSGSRSSPLVLPEVFSSSSRLEHDAKQVIQLMRHLDNLRHVTELNPLTDEMINSFSLERRIDTSCHYLRIVHGYCYYSGIESIDPDDDPLPPSPLRPSKKKENDGLESNRDVVEPLNQSSRRSGAEWRVDEPAMSILRREYDHPKGTMSVDSESLREKRLEEWFEENTKYEGQGRYRCALPPFKLFQGKEYVHKHLRTKHAEEMQKVIDKTDREQFLENYLNDPNHLDDSKVYDIRSGKNIQPAFAPWMLTSGFIPPPSMAFVPGAYALPNTSRGGGFHSYRGMRRRGRRFTKGKSPAMSSFDPRAREGPRQYADLDAPPQGGISNVWQGSNLIDYNKSCLTCVHKALLILVVNGCVVVIGCGMSEEPKQTLLEENKVACLVIGMAGSGKTSLVKRLASELSRREKSGYLVNLDPAVIQIPYEPHVDIRDTLNYKDVQRDLQLGPNGAILTCLNLFATRIDQLLDLLESRKEKVDTFVVDTPGQVEVFTWSSSGSIIAETIASSFPTVLLYVVDTPRATKPLTFVSNMIYACSIMYRMRLPLVIVFNKKDLVSTDFAKQWLTDFDAFEESLEEMEGDYSTSLARSMAFMEEFYRDIPCCSVSAETGEDVDELFVCIERAAADFASFRRERKTAVIQNETNGPAQTSRISGACSSRERILEKIGTSAPEGSLSHDDVVFPSVLSDEERQVSSSEEKQAYEEFVQEFEQKLSSHKAK